MENKGVFQSVYNPDVLSCIANLSNDEVFTPPELANKMLDTLPQELFANPDTTFLDPCCKSGVFLREIAKRLIVGLEPQIPDLEKRLEHIFTKQIFGIAITELTSLLSRRSVYCTKIPTSEYSAYRFPEDQPQGNILYQRIHHTWKDGKCIHCGASQNEYDRDAALETHAYQFIHNLDVKKVFNMKFDVIIGNPPYQLSDGGAGASATPIFQLFVEQAQKLMPRYLTMIIPAKWYSGGKKLDDFRHSMLSDSRLRVIHDFKSASDCFSGVEIKGGVMYFLWDRDYKGEVRVYEHVGDKIVSVKDRPLLEKGLDVFIRHNDSISILHKIMTVHPEILNGNSAARIVSSRKPFGFATNYKEYGNTPKAASVKIYGNKQIGYIDNEKILIHREWINKWKVLTAKANNIGTESPDDNLNTIIAPPNSCCTETYLVVGGDLNLTEEGTINLSNYLKTTLVRFLISLRKTTQDAAKGVYQFVPLQDFSKPWTDEELYAKYGLTEEEIAFIESMIRPME